MKKSILNLGKALSRTEQRLIEGGRLTPYDDYEEGEPCSKDNCGGRPCWNGPDGMECSLILP